MFCGEKLARKNSLGTIKTSV
ncbi:hypothetical protein LEMLEM_LOCUS24599 [Lemmus lemmus]